MTFVWDQPVRDPSTKLPIDAYRVYWDAGYLLSGNFELLATINSYEKTSYEATNLEPGKLYRF